MMGVLVGFVGKPVGMSGVSEDLSTRFEDMMDVERFQRDFRRILERSEMLAD